MRVATPARGPVLVAAARRPATRPDLRPDLPRPLADRLAGLIAQDPGLAAAVSMQLPAARASARALAGYLPPVPAPPLDLKV